MLEKLVDDGNVFNAVTFNLSTIYERKELLHTQILSWRHIADTVRW